MISAKLLMVFEHAWSLLGPVHAIIFPEESLHCPLVGQEDLMAMSTK